MDIFRKIIPAITAAVIFLSAGCITAYAENTDKVVDNADILTDSEEKQLEEYILEIIEEHGKKYDIAVLTEYGINGSITAHTDDYYDYKDYGYGADHSGIILCIDMEERAYWMSTCGGGVTVFTDCGLEHIENDFISDLKSGDYSGAFRSFVSSCDGLIDYYEENGSAYDVDSASGKWKDLFRFIVSLAIGVITALLICTNLRKQLNSAAPQTEAFNYIRNGSFRLTGERDRYLYKKVRRSKIESSSSGGSRGGSSTHTSSSGRSHGGSGGHF